MQNPFELIDQRLSAIEVMLAKILENQASTPLVLDVKDEHFTPAELAKYMKCHVETIRLKKRNGELPFHQHGRKIIFKKSEIDALTENKALKL